MLRIKRAACAEILSLISSSIVSPPQPSQFFSSVRMRAMPSSRLRSSFVSALWKGTSRSRYLDGSRGKGSARSFLRRRCLSQWKSMGKAGVRSPLPRRGNTQASKRPDRSFCLANPGALRELVSSRVLVAAFRSRWRERSITLKKPPQDPNWIGQVHHPVVVCVRSVFAGGKRSPSKKPVQDEDGIGDGDLPVPVRISAAKASRRGRGRWEAEINRRG